MNPTLYTKIAQPTVKSESGKGEFANTLSCKETQHGLSSMIFVTTGVSSANTRNGFSLASFSNDLTRARDETV